MFRKERSQRARKQKKRLKKDGDIRDWQINIDTHAGRLLQVGKGGLSMR